MPAHTHIIFGSGRFDEFEVSPVSQYGLDAEFLQNLSLFGLA